MLTLLTRFIKEHIPNAAKASTRNLNEDPLVLYLTNAPVHLTSLCSGGLTSHVLSPRVDGKLPSRELYSKRPAHMHGGEKLSIKLRGPSMAIHL